MQSGYYYASATAPSGCALLDSVYVEVTLDVCGEICGNGIDDDGDGLIDCADPDCGCCSLEEVVLTTACDDGGTPLDASDDRYAVFADLRGANVAGKPFRVTGDVDLPAIYAGSRVLIGIFPIDRAGVTFDFASLTDSTCVLRGQTIESPGTCTESCYVEVVEATATECTFGQYSLEVTVRYANPRGDLLINGKRFTTSATAGTETFTLPRLSCTGKTDLPLEVRFEDEEACDAAGLFDAACPDEACLPTGIEIGARP